VSTNRRNFLKLTATAAGAVGLGAFPEFAWPAVTGRASGEPAWLVDAPVDANFPRAAAARRSSDRTLCRPS